MTSKDSPLETLLWRILNDRKIFSYRNNCDRIIEQSEMSDFTAWLISGDLPKASRFLENKMQRIPQDQRCIHARQFTRRLKTGLLRYRTHLARACSPMDDFGILHCQLPDNMEDYGRVVEREPRPTVDQFLAYKIEKAGNRWRKQALQRLMEHLAWGY